MKFLHLFFIFGLIVTAKAEVELQRITEFGNNPGELKMFVQTPSSSDSLRPLIVALHGCSQTAASMSKVSGWDQLAEKYNLIVLYPEQRRINNPSNCFNWFQKEDQEANSGELESIMEMISYCKTNYPVDTNQIFVYGLSAGAAMGVNLMAVHPEIFNAGAILAGAPYKAASNPHEAMKAMFSEIDKTGEEWAAKINRDSTTIFPKLIVIQGDQDHTVKPSNALELIEQWSTISQMDSVADFSQSYLNPEMTKYYYNATYRKNQIIFYKIADIGHAIPIDPGKEEHQGGKVGLFSKDIDFFSTFYILQDFGVIK